jgi:hypothetical protein
MHCSDKSFKTLRAVGGALRLRQIISLPLPEIRGQKSDIPASNRPSQRAMPFRPQPATHKPLLTTHNPQPASCNPKSSFPHSDFPILYMPYAPCPMPCVLCPMPFFPVPTTQYPIPSTQHPIPNTHYPLPSLFPPKRVFGDIHHSTVGCENGIHFAEGDRQQ